MLDHRWLTPQHVRLIQEARFSNVQRPPARHGRETRTPTAGRGRARR